MAMVKKSITVTDQQDAWIQAQLATGSYASDSEVFRELIRREQTRSNEIEAIRAAIIEGEQSGMSERTPQQIVEAAKERLRVDGKL